MMFSVAKLPLAANHVLRMIRKRIMNSVHTPGIMTDRQTAVANPTHHINIWLHLT